MTPTETPDFWARLASFDRQDVEAEKERARTQAELRAANALERIADALDILVGFLVKQEGD